MFFMALVCPATNEEQAIAREASSRRCLEQLQQHAGIVSKG